MCCTRTSNFIALIISFALLVAIIAITPKPSDALSCKDRFIRDLALCWIIISTIHLSGLGIISCSVYHYDRNFNLKDFWYTIVHLIMLLVLLEYKILIVPISDLSTCLSLRPEQINKISIVILFVITVLILVGCILIAIPRGIDTLPKGIDTLPNDEKKIPLLTDVETGYNIVASKNTEDSDNAAHSVNAAHSDNAVHSVNAEYPDQRYCTDGYCD